MPNRTDKRQKKVVKSVVLIGFSRTINGQAVTVFAEGAAGHVKWCTGTVTITDEGAGYDHGCKYEKDNGDGTTSIYYNEGDETSCDFNLSETLAAVVTSVAAGSGLTGGGTEGALTLTVGAGRGTTVRADNVDVGVDVYNTLGALGIGVLVNLSGFDTTNGVTMTLADADAGIQATHVTIDAIANNTAGVVYPVGLATGDATNNLDTSGQTIGDLVYLSGTAGGFVFAALTGADQLSQAVGVVKVVSATVGQIFFFPGAQRILKLPTTMLQDSAIATAKIAANAVTGAKIPNAAIGTLAHLDLAAVVVDHADASPKEILAADADQERLALVVLVATEAAAGDPDIDIGVASDTNSVVDDFGAGAWAVGDRLVRLVRIPAGDNLRATIAAAGTAGAMDVFVHLLTLNVNPANLAASEALTATADGLTTGLMSGNANHAVVTSAAATNAITLPASSAALVGKAFTIWVGANGFELLTPASSGATINGTDSDGTNQADIPANSLSRLALVDTDTWILENIGSTGTVAAAIVPDND